MRNWILLVVTLMLGGCSSLYNSYLEWEYLNPDEYPVLEAVGYASISAQPGDSKDTRMLNAIKVSKLEAYRELAEQLNGQMVEGSVSVGDLAVGDDRMRAEVNGLVRGARIVRSYAVGDTYVTEMSLDTADLQRIYTLTAPVRRVKDVQYY